MVGEAGDAPAYRAEVARFLEDLARNPGTEIAPADSDLFRRRLALSARPSDKSWSLTDCISFVVMSDRGLTDALTGDHHFDQAGFKALLRDT